MDDFFIFGAVYAFGLSLAASAVLFFRSKPNDRRRYFAFAFLLIPLAYIVAAFAREIFPNPRPFVSGEIMPLIFHDEIAGFPSGHTLFTAILAALAYPFSRRLSLWLWLVAIYVGLSRVYVGVHHFVDVLGAVSIVLVLATLVWKAGLPDRIARQLKDN